MTSWSGAIAPFGKRAVGGYAMIRLSKESDNTIELTLLGDVENHEIAVKVQFIEDEEVVFEKSCDTFEDSKCKIAIPVEDVEKLTGIDGNAKVVATIDENDEDIELLAYQVVETDAEVKGYTKMECTIPYPCEPLAE